MGIIRVFQNPKKGKVCTNVRVNRLSWTNVNPPAPGSDVVVVPTSLFGFPWLFAGTRTPEYFATRTQFIRKMPGRIIGVTKDRLWEHGIPA